jgi:opacity protein-like surface antigen
MFKKVLLASAILAASSTVAMAAAPYVGIGSGLVVNTLDLGQVSNVGELGIFYRGIPVNLFAGYGGMVSDSMYLAGELNGTVGTFNITDTTGLRSQYGLSLSVLPGVMLSDHTMAFARLGVVKTHFTTPSYAKWSDTTPWGGEAGLGMQTSLTQNLDLRGEYDFVAYKSTSSNTFKDTPRADQFNVSLVYNFN